MVKHVSSDVEPTFPNDPSGDLPKVKQPPLKELLVWKAPIRPFKPRSREFYTTAGSIIFLACLIMLFLHEYLLIVVLITLGFFSYVLSTVPPEETEHKLTTRGIITGGKAYPWSALGRFWFDTKWKNDVLMVEHSTWPLRLMMLLGKTDKKDLTKILSTYLEQERPEKTQIERAGDWLQQKIPLETTK